MDNKIKVIVKQNILKGTYYLTSYTGGKTTCTNVNFDSKLDSVEIVYENYIDRETMKKIKVGDDLYISDDNKTYEVKNTCYDIFNDIFIVSLEDKYISGNRIKDLMNEFAEGKFEEMKDEFSKMKSSIEQHNRKSFLERLFNSKIKL